MICNACSKEIAQEDRLAMKEGFCTLCYYEEMKKQNKINAEDEIKFLLDSTAIRDSIKVEIIYNAETRSDEVEVVFTRQLNEQIANIVLREYARKVRVKVAGQCISYVRAEKQETQIIYLGAKAVEE